MRSRTRQQQVFKSQAASKYRSILALVLPLLASGPILAAPPAPKKAPASKPAPVKTPAKPTPAAPVRPGPVWSVAFTPDGKQLAVGGYQRVFLYETETGKRIAQWPVSPDAVRALAFSPDGKYLAAGGGAPGQSGTTVIIDLAAGKPVRTLRSHTDTVEALAFNGGQILSAGDDETVRVTDLASGKSLAVLAEHVGRCLSLSVPSKTDEANGGPIFATGGTDSMVKIWDSGFRRVVVNFDQAQSPVWSLAAFPRPGRFLAGCGDGSIRFFGVSKAKEAGSPGEPPPRNGFQERVIGGAHEGGVLAVAPAPNDKFLVSGGVDDRLALWNLGGGLIRDMKDAKGDIWGVAISPESTRVASASEDGTTRVYDSEKGTLLWETPLPPLPAMPAWLAALKPGAGIGLSAAYFNNPTLADRPALTRIDATVDFPWGETGPGGGVVVDGFSGRWTGYVEAPVNGDYVFLTRSDDGVRLSVNGKQALSNWTGHGTTEDVAQPIALKAGQRVPITLEYFEGGGPGEIHLLWSYPGQDKQIIPKERLYPNAAPPVVNTPGKTPAAKPPAAVAPQPVRK